MTVVAGWRARGVLSFSVFCLAFPEVVAIAVAVAVAVPVAVSVPVPVPVPVPFVVLVGVVAGVVVGDLVGAVVGAGVCAASGGAPPDDCSVIAYYYTEYPSRAAAGFDWLGVN